jgi:uncharacterized protein involved in cysteine biosynthesis
VRNYLLGLRCGVRGLAACVSTPRLWPWAIVPAIVGVLVFFGPMYLAGDGLAETIQGLAERWGFGETAAAWTTGGIVFLFAAISLILAYFVLGPIVRIVAAPFLALLSDRWVRELAGREIAPGPGSAFVRFVIVPVRDAIVFLAIRVVLTAGLLVLLCVPVVGGFLFAAALAPVEGMDRMDVALSARAVPLGERLRFAWRNLGACAGLGTVVTLLLAVPFVNLLLLPGLAVGAVLLDRELSPDFPKAAA